MYGLPIDFDGSEFVERQLIQISFTENTIHLVFEGDVSLTLLSTFKYRLAQSDTTYEETIPVLSSQLMGLIGDKVKSATASRNGELSLLFGTGGNLTCVDDSTEYESYSIHIGDKEIIV
jgi:hypothetical protein